MTRLQITGNYATLYDRAHDMLKNNELYKEDHWRYAASQGGLASYISTLSDINKIDNINDFKNEYSWDFIDPNAAIAAMNNEINKDYTIEKHQKIKLDNMGYMVTDDKGNPVYEDYEISHYDYIKKLVQDSALQAKQEYTNKILQEQKDSLSGIEKIGNDILSFGGNLLSGAINLVEGVGKTIASTITAFSMMAATAGKEDAMRFDDIFVKMMGADYSDDLLGANLAESLADFESKYTDFRDVTGNMSGVGEVFISIADTIGKMVPGMFIPTHWGSTVFTYTGFTAQDISSTYNLAKQQGRSIPSWQIISSGAIKSVMQVVVEEGLGKIISAISGGKFGASLQDQIFRHSKGGTSTIVGDLTKEGTKKFLFRKGISNIGMSALQEGLEEVLQDMSDALVNWSYENFVNENFGIFKDENGETYITFEDLIKTFFISVCTSLITTGVKLVSTKRIGLDYEYKIDEKTGEKKLVTTDKLGKFASLGYNLTLQEAFQNADKLFKDAKKQKNLSEKDRANYTKALTQVYGAMRILGSLYNGFGKENFERASKYLDGLQESLKQANEIEKFGGFGTNYLINNAKYYANEANKAFDEITIKLGKSLKADARNKLIQKMAAAKISDIKNVVTKEDLKSNRTDLEKELGKDTVEQLMNIIDNDNDIDTIAITNKGQNVAFEKGVLVIPKGLVIKSGGQILTEIGETNVVSNIIDGSFVEIKDHKHLLDSLKEFMKSVKGMEFTNEDVVYNLLFSENNSFFEYCLYNDSDMMKEFLVDLINTVESYSEKLTDTQISEKNVLNNSIENMKASMYNYYMMFTTDEISYKIFTEQELSKLKREKFATNLRQRIMNNEDLSENDMFVIKKWINNSRFNQDMKDKYLSILVDKSSTKGQKRNILNDLTSSYQTKSLSLYDGINYFTPNTLGGRVANYYLRASNLRLRDFYLPNTELRSKMIDSGITDINVQSTIDFINKSFDTFTNGAFSFDLYNGNLCVKYSSNDKIAGFNSYERTDISERKLVTKATKDAVSKVLEGCFNSAIDSNTLSSITIEDILLDPMLFLNDKTIKDIESKTGKSLSTFSAFEYFNTKLQQEDQNYCIVITPDGGFSIGKLTELSKYLKVPRTKLQSTLKKYSDNTKKYKYSELTNNTHRKNGKEFDEDFLAKGVSIDNFINKKYLVGSLKDIKIFFYDGTNKEGFGAYDHVTNCIYINSNTLNATLAKTTLLHEFQHAVQLQQGMANGSDFMLKDYLKNHDNSQTRRNLIHILSSIKKHIPNSNVIVENGLDDSNLKILENFLYKGIAGELQSNGQYYLSFYPVVKSIDEDSFETKLIMPWGETISIGQMDGVLKVENTVATNRLGISIESFTDKNIAETFYKNSKLIQFEDLQKETGNIYIGIDGNLYKHDYIDPNSFNSNQQAVKTMYKIMPRLVFEDNQLTVYFNSTMTNESFNELKNIFDYLYKNNLDFNIINSKTTFKSDIATNSEELLKLISFTNVDSDLIKFRQPSSNKSFSISDILDIKGRYSKDMPSEQTSQLKIKKFDIPETKYNAKGEKMTLMRDEKGNIIYNKRTGMPRYKTVYKSSGRYINREDAKEHPVLKSFVGKRLDPRVKQLVIQSENLNIDKDLKLQIDKGIITYNSIKRFLINSENMNQDTFTLINDNIYHNSNIDSFEKLKELQDKLPDVLALFDAMNAIYASNNDENLRKKWERYLKRKFDIEKHSAEIEKIVGNSKSLTNRRNSHIDTISTGLDSTNNFRSIIMNSFDGTNNSISLIVKMIKSIGELNKQSVKSLNDNVAIVKNPGGSKLSRNAEALENLERLKNAAEGIAQESGDVTRADKIFSILELFNNNPEFVTKLSKSSNSKLLASLILKYSTMSTEKFEEEFTKIMSKESGTLLDNLFTASVLSEILGNKNDKIENIYTLLFEYKNVSTQSKAISIKNYVQTNIANKLSPDEAKVFLQYYSDIFNDDLTLKKEVYMVKDANGKYKYMDKDSLDSVFEKLNTISNEIKNGVYLSKRNAKTFKSFMESTTDKLSLSKFKKEFEMLQKEAAKKEKIVYKTKEVVIANDVKVFVNSDKTIPTSMVNLLQTVKFTNEDIPTMVQYFSKEDASHKRLEVSNAINQFTQENSEVLSKLTQQDVDELVDYFVNTYALYGQPGTEQYNAIQLALSAVLIKMNDENAYDWRLTQDQVDSLLENLQNIFSGGAQITAAAKAVLKFIKPTENILTKLAKDSGISYEGLSEDINKVAEACKSKNIDEMIKAKNAFYKSALEKMRAEDKIKAKALKESGDKINNLNKESSKFDKIYNKLMAYERLCMLSGPGTWARNQISNFIISRDLSSKAGKVFSDILFKAFPNKFKKIEGQYKIVGTQIEEKYQNFINKEIKDTKLLELMRDGMNKYDIRKIERSEYENNPSLLLADMIQQSVFNARQFNLKSSQWVFNFINKMMSDDKWINKRVYALIGKMMTENQTDISKGLSMDVLKTISEAYTFAAQEYMHKYNWITELTNNLKNSKAPFAKTAYYFLNQVAPFAASSWNWFVEGLKYTPIGLAKSILNFAKIENTIEKLEYDRQHGKVVMSSKFAQYAAIKDLGKGAIGTVGALIGTILAALGYVSIDDDDKDYKLKVGNVSIDISDVFGTQGIYTSIALVSQIKNKKNVFKALLNTTNIMFDDSLYSTFYDVFRYSEGVGDFLENETFNILNMMIPNFLKTFAGYANVYDVTYSPGLKGKFERLAASAFSKNILPNRKIDIYTGEDQVKYKAWWITNAINKFTPLKIYPYNVSNIEKIATGYGVSKSLLSGKYTINDVEIKLSGSQQHTLNQLYGQLNNESLTLLINDGIKMSVKNENGTYSSLTFSQMTDEQKKNAISQTMSNNAKYAKISVLTSSLGYKYYANDSEYNNLVKAGITENVYKKTGKLDGFVK